MESQRDAHSPASSIQTSLLPSDSDENEHEEYVPCVVHPPPRPAPLYPEEPTKPLQISAAWSLVFFIFLLFLPAFLINRPNVGSPPPSRKSPSMIAFSNSAANNVLHRNLINSGLNSSSDILLVYSGMGHHRRLLNDTYAFDLTSRKWTRVVSGKHETAKEPCPLPRWKSAAVSIPSQGLLVLFGDAMQRDGGNGVGVGVGSSPGKKGGEGERRFDDQVWMLELPKLKWEAANIITKERALPSLLPQARRGHSVDILAITQPQNSTATSLLLFGGVDSQGEELNDTWKATISWPNITWTPLSFSDRQPSIAKFSPTVIAERKPSPAQRPTPRHGHATATLETSLEISQNLEKQKEGREKVHRELKNDERQMQQFLAVFGGRDRTQFFNDLWLLNIENTSNTISNTTSTSISKERVSSSSNGKKIPKSEWFLFEVDEASPVPPPRAHHTIAIYEDKLYLWGGISGSRLELSKPLDDLWVLSFENRRWSRLYKHGAWPLPRFLFASVVHQPQGAVEPRLYIFGGESFDRCKLNDLWSLNLKTLIWSQLTPNYFAKRRCDKLFGNK